MNELFKQKYSSVGVLRKGLQRKSFFGHFANAIGCMAAAKKNCSGKPDPRQ